MSVFNEINNLTNTSIIDHLEYKNLIHWKWIKIAHIFYYWRMTKNRVQCRTFYYTPSVIKNSLHSIFFLGSTLHYNLLHDTKRQLLYNTFYYFSLFFFPSISWKPKLHKSSPFLCRKTTLFPDQLEKQSLSGRKLCCKKCLEMVS